MKNFVNLLLYFVLAILFFGGSGIWMPYILNVIAHKEQLGTDHLQNFSTYVIAIIAAGCIDLILITINSDKIKNKGGLVLVILIILFGSLFLVGLDFFWILNGQHDKAKFALIIGLSVAYLLWWVSNWGSKNINPINALGGDVR